jgi:hypothetical protein
MTGGVVHPLVVHPRSLDLDGSCGGRDGAGLGVAVAHHQATAVVVTLIGKAGEVGIHLRLQRHGQHPSGSFPDDLIEAEIRPRVVVKQYSQHSACPSSPALERRRFLGFGQEGRYAAPRVRSRIHRFWL